MLEIGCGWGALAETRGARLRRPRHRRHAVAPSSSPSRRSGWRRTGWPAQADLRLQDYRDIDDGPFDAIASIEMFEAVGREYWPGFFETLRDQLKPGGRACIQSITIRDDLFERYVRSTDFIQQYIFPGGLLPSPQAFRAEARKAGLRGRQRTGLRPRLRRDAAPLARAVPARATGRCASSASTTRFMRIWEFYLAYCEAAFATGNTDVMQFTLRRP